MEECNRMKRPGEAKILPVANEVSSPVEAADPVRRGCHDWADRPRRTGFPVFRGEW